MTERSGHQSRAGERPMGSSAESNWTGIGGTWIEGSPEEVDLEGLATSPGTMASPGSNGSFPGNERKLVFGLLALVVGWVIFVSVGRAVTPDTSIDEQVAIDQSERRAEATVVAQVTATAQAEATRTAEQIGSQDADAGEALVEDATTVGSPDGSDAPGNLLSGPGTLEGDRVVVDSSNLGARNAITPQVEKLQREMARRDNRVVAMYRSSGGVVFLNLTTGATHSAQASTAPIEPVAGWPVLRSGPVTIVVDPSTLTATRVASDSSLIVTDALDSAVYYVEAETISQDAAMVETVDADGDYSFFRAPGAYQLVPADGLGLLAVPKTAGTDTLIATASTGGFETLSQHRVLDGGGVARLEQVCASPTNCTMAVAEHESGQRVEVLADFVRVGDDFTLSPDGRSLIRHSPAGFAELHFFEGPAITWVAGAGVEYPAWGPGSDFIVWLDRIGRPELSVMFPDDRDRVVLDLGGWGAPPPIGPEIVVFSLPNDSP